MKNLTTNTSLTLPPKSLLSASAESAMCLQIESGLVWITIEDDAYDYWLATGDSLIIPPLKQVVIEADSQVSQIQVSCFVDNSEPEQTSLAHQNLPLVMSKQPESAGHTMRTVDVAKAESICDLR